jgi:catechol-2,3-dioxygenase
MVTAIFSSMYDGEVLGYIRPDLIEKVMPSEAGIERLGHVALWVRDLGRSQAFYCGILGLRMIKNYKNKILFLRCSGSVDSHELALILFVPEARDGKECRFCINHCAWKVSSFADLQYFYDLFCSRGLKVQIVDHGIALGIYVSDPDGHRVELYHELPESEWDFTDEEGKGALEYPLKLQTGV